MRKRGDTIGLDGVSLPTRRLPEDQAPPRVLVGADDSRWGLAALRWAAAHAVRVGGRLDTRTLDHDISDELIRASLGADLVVLGRQADSGAVATIRAVAEHADCDVVIVGGEPAAIAGANRWISVLLGSSVDDHALRSAARLAGLRRVPVRIVYGQAWAGDHAAREPIDRQLAKLHEAAGFVHALDPKLRTVTQLVWTSPADRIARPVNTDLLVVGVDQHLDVLSRAALARAVSPVLLARA